MVLRVITGVRAPAPSQKDKKNKSSTGSLPKESPRTPADTDGTTSQVARRKSERHRTFGWVDTEPGLEVEALEPGDVLNEHGIPERVMLSYLQGEIEGEAAVKNLPAAILLIVWFFLMNLAHEQPDTIHSVEKAIDYDIGENANFAFSSPLYMGHKNFQDVNTFADWYSWMNLGFSAIYFPTSLAVSEGSSSVLPSMTFPEASMYLSHNRKVGGVKLVQQKLVDAECTNPTVANAMELDPCFRFDGLDLRLKPTELDVSQEDLIESSDAVTVEWLDYLMEFPNITVFDQLRDLEVNRWLNDRTYRVKVNFMTYNAYYDLLTSTSIHFMFAISGRIFKQITHRSVILEAHASWESWAFEVLFFGHILILFFNEGFEAICCLREHKCRFAKAWKAYWSFWNFVDWVSIILAFAILITWITQNIGQADISSTLQNYVPVHSACRLSANVTTSSCAAARAYDEKLFDDMEALGFVIRANRWISGFYPVCIIMRLFKAFAAQPRLAIVTKTLALAANDLTHFGIVFLSIFFAYVAMGMAFFGREVESFASFDRASLALLRALMGDFSVEDMELRGRPVAFFFFGTYMMAAVLLLLNMLIAILMDVYGQVAAGSRTSESLWHECYDIVRRGISKWSGGHTPLPEVVKAYIASRGEEAWESDKVISVRDVMDAVPGLDQAQAEAEMTAALEEYAQENAPHIELTEVISTMGKYLAKGEEEPAPVLRSVVDVARNAETVAGENVSEAAQELVRAGLSVEVLLRAAAITLDSSAQRLDNGKAQVSALRHVISSAEILCSEDKAIMMCQL
ncbi:pkd2 [Symbiodinium natans]|uniref:Pkd2 protein n=1 Tax=Symbiodinium natans TaxID=878477 RepID=A0A812RB42_9DINO|nr:pkd2 [Symbiodinium natans]